MEQMMECLLAEMKALLEDDLEKIKVRMDVFKNKLDKNPV
jgi:5-bromo-4-chloroindolyl phosphate hydrolysis protein